MKNLWTLLNNLANLIIHANETRSEIKLSLLEQRKLKFRFMLNIVILLVSLIYFSKKDAMYQDTSMFENLMIDSFAPIQRSITYVSEETSAFFRNYVLNVDASKNNKVLLGDINQLKTKIFKYDELMMENQRLKNLLSFGEEITRKKVLAQVVAWDSSSDFRVLRINKGHNDGVRLQSPVLTADGLVGYVYKLTNFFADIRTVLDLNIRIDAIVQRTRSHGIVEGFSKNRCFMKYVTRTEALILNDIVLTSGLGNIYPKGIKIGTVSKFEKQNYGITQHVEISPSVDFSRLEEVVVLVADEAQQVKKEWDVLEK